MKHSLKRIITIIICAVSLSSTAQNLISKVSDQALFVLELNGEKAFKDISISELENSSLFEELSREVFRRSDLTQPTNFASMGIKPDSKMYFAIENHQDVLYYYFLMNIKDQPKFSEFVKAGVSPYNKANYSKTNNLNQITYNETTRLVWNDTHCIYIGTTYNGTKYKSSSYYNWKRNEYDESDYETYEIVEHATVESVLAEEELELEAYPEIVEETEYLEEEVVEMAEPEVYYESEYDKKQRIKREIFNKVQEEKKKKKALFIDSAITARIALAFTDELTNSFSPTGFDHDAVANLWYNGFDMSNLIDPFTLQFSRYGRYTNPGRFLLGPQSQYYANYSINLYLEEDKINLKSNVEFSEKLNTAAKNIYKSKLNRKFCKYLPEDLLAYTSFSINTADLLKESANITENYFETSSNFKYSQEVAAYINLIEILLDEEAIAEVITGDAVLMLNDLASKKIEYKTWEYDENFNEKRVTKTKNQMMPEFTIMMGSQNEEILTRLFKLSMKHKFLSAKESYFVSSEKYKNKLPFDMFLCFKDGILFMTNSKAQITSILNGKAENKINRTQRKHIMKNVSATYIDMESIHSKVMANEDFSKELAELNEFKGDFKEIVSTSTYKKNSVHTNAYITIPEDAENSSKYILQLVDKIIAKTKR